MRAIHLAAGKGTRLRPITEDKPKPLVDLGGTSLLERNLSTLRAAGVEDQVVVTGHAADQIRALGVDTVHNEVYDETEMVYSLFCAAEAFPSEGDLIIVYGDIVFEQRVVEALLSCDAPLGVVVDRKWRALWEERFEDPLEDAETLDLDEDGRIRSIGCDPTGYDEIDAQYTGLLKVRNDRITDFVESYRELDQDTAGYVSIDMTAFLQRLVDRGWHLQAVPVEGGWLEIDSLNDLEGFRSLYQNDELDRFIEL
jgi:choline kinase